MEKPQVLSKADKQKLGEIYFLTIDDVRDFFSKQSNYRGQNLIHILKSVLSSKENEIAKLLTQEIGKPLSQCHDEIHKALEVLEEGEQMEMSQSSLLVIGSMASPIYELADIIANYAKNYNKVVFKPSSKVMKTIKFIFDALNAEDPQINEKLFFLPMKNTEIDTLLTKISFDMIINFSRARLNVSEDKIESRHEKDSIIVINQTSDVDVVAGILVNNLFSFEEFNKSRIQHVFVSEEAAADFIQRLTSKLDLKLVLGNPQDAGVNFSDTFKTYTRNTFKEVLLELVSLGANVAYGSVEDKIKSPIVIECDENLIEYYQKSFWVPVVFVIPYKNSASLSKDLESFSDYRIQFY